MDKDYQGKVTIKEFINIWCLADENFNIKDIIKLIKNKWL